MFEGWNDIDIGDPSSWPKTFKIFGAIVIGIAIILGTYKWVVTDKQRIYDSAVRKEAELKESFKVKKALAINLDAYKKQMVEAENMFSVLKEQLPGETEIPDLLVDVTQRGLSNGLVFEQFEPLAQVNREFYKEKPVKIEVSGEYHELASFVSAVAALSRIVNVADFSIAAEKGKNADDEDSSKNTLKMKALLRTYFYQESK